MKNYLIIGGSSGIGKALTQMLNAENNRVYATYNNTLNHAVFPNITYHPLNVLDKNLSLNFLPEQLDGLVYCSGTIQLKAFLRKLLNSDEKKNANAERHLLNKSDIRMILLQWRLFLLSEKAKWITRQIINVDGGMSTLKL